MEKIIVISSDKERSRSLLKWLELLFPECFIESLPGKMIDNSEIFIPDRVGWGE